MEKRGQFYLIAAVIIIAVIIGFVLISNYSKENIEYATIYGLEEGLEIESAKVLDYGIYSELDPEQMTNLLKGFTESYAEYAQLDRLYFIFGNSEQISVAGYHDLEDGEILVDIGGTKPSTLIISKKEYKKEDFPAQETDITIVIITINDIEYKFDLKPGENFYFILMINFKGEQYVVTNQDEDD
jgi:hypothetical protein